MFSSYGLRYKEPLRWIALALCIKLLLFIFFSLNFLQNWPSHWITKGIFIISGDTNGYYNPIESWVNGNGYDTMCRMPGLLPIYAPLYFFFGSDWGKVFVILLQFLFSSISVYLLALIAKTLFKINRIFYISFFLYAFSSFVSIWDHYGYADSFSTSFLICAVYYFINAIEKKGVTKYLFYGGFCICWSVFFRPVIVAVFIILCIIYIIQFYSKLKTNLNVLARNLFIFSLPLIICISIWTFRNYNNYNLIVALQAPNHMCFGNLLKHHTAVRNLVIAWGDDFQEWTNTGRFKFFLTPDEKDINKFFNKTDFTSYYNEDSLIMLKESYLLSMSDTISIEQRNYYRNKSLLAANTYYNSYKKEHWFRFYILNRILLIKKFIFPNKLDNLPFPKFSSMSVYHKVIKGGYLALLNLITLLSLIGILQSLIYKKFIPLLFSLIPFGIIFLLAGMLGYIEQRYLVPAYPFLIVFASYSIAQFTLLFNNRNKI